MLCTVCEREREGSPAGALVRFPPRAYRRIKIRAVTSDSTEENRVIASVKGIFEAHLAVRDVALSTGFYRDRVGLELAHLSADQAAFFWVGGRGHTMLGLWAAGAGSHHVTSHIAFATALSEVIAATASLERSGIMPLDFEGRRTAQPVVLAWMPAAAVYFRDPDDHLLEFIAMLDDEARPEDGVVTWSDWNTRKVRNG